MPLPDGAGGARRRVGALHRCTAAPSRSGRDPRGPRPASRSRDCWSDGPRSRGRSSADGGSARPVLVGRAVGLLCRGVVAAVRPVALRRRGRGVGVVESAGGGSVTAGVVVVSTGAGTVKLPDSLCAVVVVRAVVVLFPGWVWPLAWVAVEPAEPVEPGERLAPALQPCVQPAPAVADACPPAAADPCPPAATEGCGPPPCGPPPVLPGGPGAPRASPLPAIPSARLEQTNASAAAVRRRRALGLCGRVGRASMRVTGFTEVSTHARRQGRAGNRSVDKCCIRTVQNLDTIVVMLLRMQALTFTRPRKRPAGRPGCSVR